jgi:hypothetical protein
LICVDHNGNFFCLSFYNVGTNFLETIQLNKTNIVIMDPIVKNITAKKGDDDKILEYTSIQVTNLSKVLIDGKYCSNYASHSLLISKFFN